MSVQVKSFRTSDEVDAFLFDEPMYCPAALHFTEINDTVMSYGIQTNSTALSKRGIYEDPTFKFQIPLQIAAEREIARSLLGGIRFDIMFYYVFCSSYFANLFLCFLLRRSLMHWALMYYYSDDSMFSFKL